MDLLSDWQRGIVTIDANALTGLLPQPVCIMLNNMAEIELYSIFGAPQRMPPPDLTHLPIPDTELSYSSQSRLIHNDMDSYLPFDIYMSSTGFALKPQPKRSDSYPAIPTEQSIYLPKDFSDKPVLRYQYSPPNDDDAGTHAGATTSTRCSCSCS